MFFVKDIMRVMSTREVRLCFILYLIFYIIISLKAGVPIYEDTKILLTSLFFVNIKTVDYLNMFYFILPLLCGIVGSDIFARDIRNRMIKNIYTRLNIAKEIQYRAILSFVSGGIFVVSIFILDILVKASLYPNLEPSMFGSYRMFDKYYYADLWINHSNFYILFALVTNFMFSGLCSLTGFAVSLFNPRKIANSTAAFLIEFSKYIINSIFAMKQFTFLSIMSFVGVKMHGELYIMFPSFFITLFILTMVIHYRSKAYELLI